MPFTLYHFGIAMIIFALCPFIDPLAIFLGTVIIDIEGILYLLFQIGVAHGYSHSLLGVMIYILPCSFFSWLAHLTIKKIFKKPIKFNWPLSLLSGLLGLLSHVIFDAFLYSEIRILYPFSKITGYLYGVINYQTAVIILTSLFCIGLGILLIKLLIKYAFKKDVLICYNFQKRIANKKQINEITQRENAIREN